MWSLGEINEFLTRKCCFVSFPLKFYGWNTMFCKLLDTYVVSEVLFYSDQAVLLNESIFLMKERSTAIAYTEKDLIKNLLQLHSTVENTTEYPDNLPEKCAMAGSTPRLQRDLMAVLPCAWFCLLSMWLVPSAHFIIWLPSLYKVIYTFSLNKRNLYNFKFTCKTLYDNRDHPSLRNSYSKNNLKHSNILISEISYLYKVIFSLGVCKLWSNFLLNFMIKHYPYNWLWEDKEIFKVANKETACLYVKFSCLILRYQMFFFASLNISVASWCLILCSISSWFFAMPKGMKSNLFENVGSEEP